MRKMLGVWMMIYGGCLVVLVIAASIYRFIKGYQSEGQLF